MIRSALISSLEKCFPQDEIASYDSLESISILKGERLSFQLISKLDGLNDPHVCWCRIELSGELAKYATVRSVELIPSFMPVHPVLFDDNYLPARDAYPDLLSPIPDNRRVMIAKHQLRSLFITVEPSCKLYGEFPLTVRILSYESDDIIAEHILHIKIVNAELPRQSIKYTQWFHGDCLSSYYNCAPLSSRWWKIVDNFVKTAAHTGINMLLTPVFTPPLDTAIGHERPTVQLVDVTLSAGEYKFGFKNLDRWLRIAKKHGIEYYEISHLFTQWGAAHAPKIMATVDGEYCRIFGWDTDATGAEYTRFLREFITQFIQHMKARGEDKKCIFHISDEPHSQDFEQYRRSRESIIDLLSGYTVMDALSDYDFYKMGIVENPIPCNDKIGPFIENGVKNLWTYYCCAQCKDVSNRLFSMPLWRTRCIGAQFYKFDIAGFLQWGYNFYYSQGSLEEVNPYLDSTGKYWVPSGDTYSVYPAQSGEALESIRAVAFYEALQDVRAFKLCESLIGKDATLKIIENIYGDVSFDNCVTSARPLLLIRHRINETIEANIDR